MYNSQWVLIGGLILLSLLPAGLFTSLVYGEKALLVPTIIFLTASALCFVVARRKGRVETLIESGTASLSDEPEGRTIVLDCRGCRERYILGQDAVAVTFFDVIEDHRRLGAVVDDNRSLDSTSPDNPDLVGRMAGNWDIANLSRQRQTIDRLVTLVWAQHADKSFTFLNWTRWWRCESCLTIQPYNDRWRRSTRTDRARP